jgi:hypothetical protein
MGGILGAAVVVALIVWAFVAWGRGYRRLFEAGHIAELALVGRNTGTALREALSGGDRTQVATEPYLTQHSVAVMGSVHRLGNDFVYHLSISRPGDVLAVAAGGRFLYLVAAGIGIHEHLTAWAHTSVLHAAFRVPAGSHAGLRTALEEPRTQEEATRLLTEAARFLNTLASAPRLESEDALLKYCGLE